MPPSERAAGALRRLAGLAVLACFAACAAADDAERRAEVQLASLEELSIESLRARAYGSQPRLVARLGEEPLRGLIAAYSSDGYRVYTRIDVPSAPMPAAGYPVVVFLHGWVSNEEAPRFDFGHRPGMPGPYAAMIDAYAREGFVVLMPGWRGFGTIDGRPAEGHGFLEAWNDASYLWPMFAAIDALNLVDGLPALAEAGWEDWSVEVPVRIDTARVFIAGHSQGGDSVLTALAVSGEGSRVATPLSGGSIWAGCFAPRFQQLETYEPMASSRHAFLAGDGRWTGTAIGRDGRINRQFVFGWPPEWIGSPHPADWSWQRTQWREAPVAEVVRRQYGEMYASLRRGIPALADARFTLSIDKAGGYRVAHDPRVAAGMARIGGFDQPRLLSEPLLLHYSDRDYYSPPAWNEDLSRRVNAVGGRSYAFSYPGNTHGLQRSEHAWVSGADTVAGFPLMLARDVALFNGADPNAVAPPPAVTK